MAACHKICLALADFVAAIASLNKGASILFPAMSKPKNALPHASSTASRSVYWQNADNLCCRERLARDTTGDTWGLFASINSRARFFDLACSSFSCLFCTTRAQNFFFMCGGARTQTWAINPFRNSLHPDKWMRAFSVANALPPILNSQKLHFQK